MKMHSVLSRPFAALLAAASLLAGSAPAAAAADYAVFAVLPSLQSRTYPVARNDAGDVTGVYYDGVVDGRRGFLRKASGEIVTFEVAGGGPLVETAPVAISSEGVVSGYYRYTVAPYSVGIFRRAVDGSIVTFTDPTASAIWGVAGNRAGDLAGYLYLNADGRTKGYVLSAPGVYSPFGEDGADTVPSAINDLGEVVGLVDRKFGFLRAADGTIETIKLPRVFGTNMGVDVTGLNNAGTVIGQTMMQWCYMALCHRDYEGFVRSRDGTITAFRASGRQSTQPSAINGAGAVAGTTFQPSGMANGFVRSPDGAITTFRVPQMKATYAGGIGDDGVVFGSCFDANDQVFGFLRTP